MLKRVNINGKWYSNLLYATRDRNLNRHKIPYKVVCSRYCLGVSKEDLFSNTIDDRVTICGVRYDNLYDAIENRKLNKLNLTITDVAERYKLGISLDRIFDSSYKCIIYNGKVYSSLLDICNREELNIYNISYKILSKRISNGVSLEKALNNPIITHNKFIEFNGIKYKNLTEIANNKEVNKLNIKESTIRTRICRGMTIEEALNKQLKRGKTK